MSVELKPCPHCGGDDLEVYRFMQVAKTDERYVWCHGCEAHGPIGFGATHAVERWNRRTPGPDVARLLAAAKYWRKIAYIYGIKINNGSEVEHDAVIAEHEAAAGGIG